MGYFTVLKPCVVGKLHYATVPAQPIEVDDDVAAPLVESGCLELYRPGAQAIQRNIARATEAINAVTLSLAAEVDDEPLADPPSPRTRGRRKSTED